MNISLCDVKELDNGYLFEIEITIRNKRNKRRVSVWITLLQDLSLAVTFL
jgi:hypothetical protein